MEKPGDICFNEIPSRRTLKLMLAGFFHDIGKSVVDHRHAMEGSIILSSYKSKDLYQFSKLSEKLAPKSKKPKNGEDPFLDRDDLLFIADLIDCHDLFGTLSTGENGYMRFVNLIERIERYVRRRKRKQDSEHISEEDIKEIKKGGKEFLFDVWLLNVADIMVSRKDKYTTQVWQKYPPGSDQSKENIENFFNSSDNVANIQQGRDLLHDLKIAFIIFNTHIEEIFDTYTKSKKREYFKSSISIKKAANKCSYDHIIGRIRRIVKASLFTEIEGQKKRIEDEIEETKENLKASKEHLEDFFDKLKSTKIYQLDGIIETSIKCSTNYSEFLNSLSWIGQLDYSLGFFKKIAEHSLYKVGKQIFDIEHKESTGWINDNYENISVYLKEGDCKDLNEINSKYFLDNYVSLIVKILSYLLCKKEPIDEMINIEFEDAAKRLTEDKIDEISVFEGPARASKSTMSILNRVFLYYLN